MSGVLAELRQPFAFTGTAATEIYTLSLHDALPISEPRRRRANGCRRGTRPRHPRGRRCSRSEEHTSELQSQSNLVCRLLLEKKKLVGPATGVVARPLEGVSPADTGGVGRAESTPRH